VPGPDAGAWIGAVCGIAAALTIGVFVVWGGRSRPGYDPWRDDMTQLGDGTDDVARWFIAANTMVGFELGVFGLLAARTLGLPGWVEVVLIAAGVNSLVIGLTGCRRQCSFGCCRGSAPRLVRWSHGLAAGANAIGIVAVPLIVSLLVREEPGRRALELAGYVIFGVALILLLAYVVARTRRARLGRSSRAGLLERLLWTAGYGWVITAAVTLVTGDWWWPTIAVGVWGLVALHAVLRPGWRDPSPEFRLDDCQPNTVQPLQRLVSGCLLVGRIDDPERFSEDVLAALREPSEPNSIPLLCGTVRQGGAPAVVTMAVSARGLHALGVNYRWNAPFTADPFGDGMRERAGVLGDADDSAPCAWEQGWCRTGVHVAFWIVANDDDALEPLRARVEATFPSVTFTVRERTLQPRTPGPGGRAYEHFGFVDGIGSPWIDRVPLDRPNDGGGVRTRRGRWRPIALGEFLLGHIDETQDVFPVPDPAELFEGGTFMVVRKLEQDVAAFRRFELRGRGVGDHTVGRTTAGIPLIASTDVDEDRNDFLYGEDPEGLRCPLGAHIRRANPRDGLGFGTTLTARRRLIRRGMPYGAEYGRDPLGTRGLLFVAYNVRLADQFEFIQSQWLNTGTAFGLGSDPDMIAGQWSKDDVRSVTISGGPGRPVRQPVRPLVRVRGGEYFFVPSIPGLRELARLSGPAPRAG
jgi:Dyp-type peroxidase family